MKISNGFTLFAAIAVLAFSGCSGGDSSASGGGVTAAAVKSTSSNVMATSARFGWWGQVIAGQILGTLGAGTGTNFACEWRNDNSQVSCKTWDSRGSEAGNEFMCTIQGSYDSSLSRFTLNYDCYDYRSLEDTDEQFEIDGEWSAMITLNTSFSFDAFNAYAAVDAQKQTATDCTIDSIEDVCGGTFADSDATYTVDCDGNLVCSDSGDEWAFSIDWTAGTRGVLVTHTCGSTVSQVDMGTGSAMTADVCQPSASQLNISFTRDGTINNEPVSDMIDLLVQF
jgi:hypothetical protein